MNEFKKKLTIIFISLVVGASASAGAILGYQYFANKEVATTVESLRGTTEDLRGQLSTANKLSEQLRAELSDAKKSVEDISGTNRELVKRNGELKDKLEFASKQLNSATATIGRLENALKSERARVAELETTIREFTEIIGRGLNSAGTIEERLRAAREGIIKALELIN